MTFTHCWDQAGYAPSDQVLCSGTDLLRNSDLFRSRSPLSPRLALCSMQAPIACVVPSTGALVRYEAQPQLIAAALQLSAHYTAQQKLHRAAGWQTSPWNFWALRLRTTLRAMAEESAELLSNVTDAATGALSAVTDAAAEVKEIATPAAVGFAGISPAAVTSAAA